MSEGGKEKVTPIPLQAVESKRLEARLMSPRATELPLMPLMHANLCDHERYSRLADLHVMVGDKVYYCVRGVFEVRLPHIFTAAASVKERNGVMVMQLGEPASECETFARILRYVYTGEVPLDMMKMEQCMRLFQMAAKIGAPTLALEVEQYLNKLLTVDNVFEFLASANRLKLQSIKKLALDFAARNYTQVVTNKEGIAMLGIELFQELTLYNEGIKSDGSALTKEAPYKDAVIPNKVRKDFESLYRQMPHPDAVARCLDGDVPFHRAVLAAYTDKFLQKFQEESDSRRHPFRYDFGDVTKGSFQGLVEVIYYGSSNMSVRDACGLIATMVLPYNLPAIRGVCELVLDEVNVSTCLEILNITYAEACRGRTKITSDLRKRCLELVKDQFGAMSIECLRDMSAEMAFDVVSALHSAHSASGSETSESPPGEPSAAELFITSPRATYANTRTSPRDNFKKKKHKSSFFK